MSTDKQAELDQLRKRNCASAGRLGPLEAKPVSEQVHLYIDQHGWDVAEDEEGWKAHQQSRMAEDYGEDTW